VEHGHCLEQSLQNLLSMRNPSITTSRMKVDMEERFPSLRISLDCGVFRKAVVSGSAKEMSTDLASLRLWQKKLRHFRALLIRMHRNSHLPEIFRQESVNSARRQDSLFRKQSEKLFVASTRVLQ